MFARTTPTQKADIVKRYKQVKKKQETLVAYCGDGANDTLALKESDIGLSISKDEASLAAPFRTTNTELSTMVNLLLEGRASLSLNFSCFKYYLFYCYAETVVQFICIFRLLDMSTFAYMWIDFVVIIPLTFMIGNIRRRDNLTKNLPSDSILALESSLSFFFSIALVIFVSVLCMVLAPDLDGYLTPTEVNDEMMNGRSTNYFETAVKNIKNLIFS